MAQQTTSTSRILGQLSGGLCLAGVSWWRLLWSRQTVISFLLLTFAGLAVAAWSLHRRPGAQAFVDELLLPIYVSFLLPMFCLCYATPAVAADREDQTLVYLLATPLPRPVVFAAKYAAALALALAWTCGTWAALSWSAGPVGRELFRPFWPAVFWSTLAYVGLFLLFSVLLRRATIVGLIYALFMEAFLGNMPGVVKRLAISFYTECLILDAGSRLGLHPTAGREPALLVPVSGAVAWWVLCGLAAILFLVGAGLFSRREYS